MVNTLLLCVYLVIIIFDTLLLHVYLSHFWSLLTRCFCEYFFVFSLIYTLLLCVFLFSLLWLTRHLCVFLSLHYLVQDAAFASPAPVPSVLVIFCACLLASMMLDKSAMQLASEQRLHVSDFYPWLY